MTEQVSHNAILERLASNAAVTRLADAVRTLGASDVFLVGGTVRDAAINVAGEKADFDLAMPEVDGGFVRMLAGMIGGTAFVLDEETGAWRISSPDGFTVDILPFRGETIEKDLEGRDFTINALAYDLTGSKGLLDPLGGLFSLDRKLLVLCAEDTLANDPLRVLRAYRFAATLGMRFGPGLPRELLKAAPLLREVSGERIRYELFRLLNGPHAATTLRRAVEEGVWEVLFPFISKWRGFDQGSYHDYDLLEHSIRVVESLEAVLVSERLYLYGERIAAHLSSRHEEDVTRLSLLKWASFFHDLAKPETLTVEKSGRRRFIGHDVLGAKASGRLLDRLKTGRKTKRAAARIIAAHMRLFGLAEQTDPTTRSRLRFIRDLDEETVEALLLSIADEYATGERAEGERERFWATANQILGLYFDKEEEVPALLRGRDVLDLFGVEEGPLVGLILAAVADAESAGKLRTREEAVAFAGEFLAGLSVIPKRGE